MAKTVDTCGLSCPQPVLMTLSAIKAGTEDMLLVQTDNEASRENVSRAATKSGWTVDEITEDEGIFTLTLRNK
jgi:TusA-related sulfurtransferase